MHRHARLRRITTPRRLPALVAVTMVVAGCSAGAPDAPSASAPVLVFGDSTVLADTGSLMLGDLAFAGLHVDEREIWVGDSRGGRVVRFDRRGQPVGAIGAKGRGPGELGAVGPLAGLVDGGVVVWDYMANKVVAYDVGSGALRWESALQEQAMPLQLQAVGDTVWLGAVSVAGNTGAMRISPRDDRSQRLAPLPAEYVAGLARFLPFSVALRSDSALLVGYAGDGRLFDHHLDGRVDTLAVPHRLRRGVPPDILEQLMSQRGKADAVASENLVSTLARMARLADGSLALIHYDVGFDPTADTPATTTVWLTVLDRELRRACVDATLPRTGQGVPSLAFRGDTIFTLEQVIDGEQAVPVLRSYVISTDGCAWMPVEKR